MIAITAGLPNAAVNVTLSRNGVTQGTKLYQGKTDPSGSFQSTGYFPPSTAAAWVETWYVDDVQASPMLSFMVTNATAVSILVPNTTIHDTYLFDSSYSVDTQNYAGLPHFFYAVNVENDPPLGSVRTRCEIAPNPGIGYNPAGKFDWYQYWPGADGNPPGAAGKAPTNPTSPPNPLTSAEGLFPVAATGEYYESSQFSYAPGKNVGFVFNGEFNGQAMNTPAVDGYYVEAAYFSDRECFDAGTEFGWFRLPIQFVPTLNLSQPPTVVTFYYSEFTNCGGAYICSYSSAYSGAIGQLTNSYNVTLASTNAAGTYQFNFQVLRVGSNFEITITDPITGSPTACTVNEVPSSTSQTKITFPVSGLCAGVLVGIDSWYPSSSVTNTGYITFADQSNSLYPPSYDYVPYVGAGALTPGNNIVGTSYTNGVTAAFAGLNVLSASILYQ